MNVAETILARGEDRAVAVFDKNGAGLTYAELREAVARVAAGLLARGYAKGDRIGIWSENSRFFIVCYLGVIRAGLVAVPFQTELDEQSFAKIASDAGIRGLLVSSRFIGRVRPWAERAGLLVLSEQAVSEWPARPVASW